MNERKPLIVANWKMYLDAKNSKLAADSLVRMERGTDVDVVVCPSYPLLASIREILAGSGIELGAQDVHFLEKGAFTGDVSVGEVKDFVRYVIVGHSERRHYHGDTDEIVALKVRLLLRSGLHPIVCVGESAEERDEGKTIQKIRQQVEMVLKDLPLLDFPRIIFAYEPIWAISPSLEKSAPQPEPQEVAEISNLIRKLISDSGGNKYMEKMRVIYGGSVNAKNVAQFVKEPGVDGVLVGGASTRPADLISIIREVVQCRS